MTELTEYLDESGLVVCGKREPHGAHFYGPTGDSVCDGSPAVTFAQVREGKVYYFSCPLCQRNSFSYPTVWQAREAGKEHDDRMRGPHRSILERRAKEASVHGNTADSEKGT